MFDRNGHLTDEGFIRLIDGEASIIIIRKACSHCAECSACRSRRSRFEKSLSEFADLYSSTINSQILKSSWERRAELEEQLTIENLNSSTVWIGRFTQYLGYLFIAVAIFAFTTITLFRTNVFTQYRSTSVQNVIIRLLPDKALTPSATQPVNLMEVCSQQQGDLDPSVPDPVKKIVFQEYGMSGNKIGDYQVDYLINPQLGGTGDVRNLWPEPYGSTGWNAHTKDALEVRLHHTVCDNQIDLALAQREIATDWIAAYKKYFHTENPT